MTVKTKSFWQKSGSPEKERSGPQIIRQYLKSFWSENDPKSPDESSG
jgi:hypothetical protein